MSRELEEAQEQYDLLIDSMGLSDSIRVENADGDSNGCVRHERDGR